MRIVLLTQDEPLFLAPSIEQLLESLPTGCEIVACVIFEPSPNGRKTSIMAQATQLLRVFGLRYFLHYAGLYARSRFRSRGGITKVLAKRAVPEIRLASNINTAASIARIEHFEPDLLVSIAGNQIFRKPLIDIAPEGCLNLHTSPLPHYRGLMPTFWVLRFDEKETAVSVFFVNEGIDSGPLLVQHRVPILTNCLESLIRQTKQLGISAVIEAIAKVRDGDVATMPNEIERGSYFGFPTRDDVAAFRAAGKLLY